MNSFSDFINESARTKFPTYKVGDMVILKPEYASLRNLDKNEVDSNILKTSWKFENYESYGGALCEIYKINEERKEYIVKIVGGILGKIFRRSGIPSVTSFSPDSNSYTIVNQKHLTDEGVKEFLKIQELATFKSGDKVSVNIGGNTKTKTVLGLSISKSIEMKKPVYKLIDVTTLFPEDEIETEDELDDITRDELAKELAKHLSIKFDSENSIEFIYDVIKVDCEKLITGKMYFKSLEDRDKMLSDLEKLVEKYADKNLQKIMNDGEPSNVIVMKPTVHVHSWERGKIKKEKIVQAAKTVGIKVKEFLHAKRGRITGRKFGI